jgi:hypothetical protein
MNAYKDPYNKLLSDLRELTETNNHTEALLQIAKYFRLRKLVNAFEAIETLHIEMGSLDFNLEKVRNRFNARLFNHIRESHGEQVRNQIYDCL